MTAAVWLPSLAEKVGWCVKAAAFVGVCGVVAWLLLGWNARRDGER